MTLGSSFSLALPAVPALDVALRPYQSEAIARVRDAFREGTTRLLVTMPTGAGKTFSFATLALSYVRNGEGVLVIAHRTELLDQAHAKLTEKPPFGLGIPTALVGVIRASDGRNNPNAPIQVASVQTLAARIGRATRRRQTLAAGVPGATVTGVTARDVGLPAVGLIIIDEAHRALAQSYQLVTSLYPGVRVAGWTASPYRLDGRGMDEFYERLLVATDVETLIVGGWLVRTRVYSHKVKADLSGVKVNRGGDYDERTLQEAMDLDVLVGNIVDHWLTHAGGARTFVYAAGIAHSRHLAERFRDRGVPALHVDGETPAAQRKQALEDFRAGKILVICNYDLYVEGVDVPECKCIVMARPTKAEAIWRQSAGRCMRPYPGVPEITHAVILDHSGCGVRFGLPEDAQEFRLTGRERRGTGEAPVKECPGCFRNIPANLAECPECGWLFGEEREPGSRLKEKAGELAELTTVEKKKVGELRSTIEDAMKGADAARRWKPGTANACCVAEFGKSRRDMKADELREVIAWLTSPAFARQYPLPGDE